MVFLHQIYRWFSCSHLKAQNPGFTAKKHACCVGNPLNIVGKFVGKYGNNLRSELEFANLVFETKKSPMKGIKRQ